MKQVVNPKNKKQEIVLLDNLTKSVAFVKKYRKGKTRAKSIQQLMNEL